MEVKEMQMSDIEKRSAEIEELLKSDDADIDSLTKEVEELENRKAEILTEVEARKKEMEEALKSSKEVEVIETEERKTTMDKEFRNSKEYIDAFAEYVKGDDREMRELLTTHANGTVEVPDYVSDRIRTDWENLPILSRVRKVSIKGDYTVQYEASATGAVKHTEGDTRPSEEVLELASVKFISEYYKKWIKVSDSVLALRGEAFLDYLLREFEHQIGLALENAIVAEIKASPLAAKVTNPIDNTAVMAAFAQLSDEAANPVVIISKANYAAIMNERTTAGAKIEDPFNGLEVLFNNTVQGVLVGDLSGVEVNFPDGYDFKYIIDNTTYAEHDLVKIVGKVMAAMHLVQPNGFAVVSAS
jgi:HK97 family phage major capsid protein